VDVGGVSDDVVTSLRRRGTAVTRSAATGLTVPEIAHFTRAFARQRRSSTGTIWRGSGHWPSRPCRSSNRKRASQTDLQTVRRGFL